jgi:hypothetical protein
MTTSNNWTHVQLTLPARWFKHVSVAALCAAGLLLPRPATPQALTGNLIGTVSDEQGAIVPGALVRVSSPALIGGSSTQRTNDKGQFRFWALPPGPYTLEVELQAFAPVREDDIRIGIAGTIERTIVLKVAGRQESVIVEGAGSRVEARTSGLETRFGPEYLQTIPGRRYSMFDLVKSAPGISPTSPSSGTNNAVTAFGSGTNENAFLLDGTNFTCPCSGNALAEPGIDTIQEIQIQTVGASAEYGNIQGAVFNVVTKHGSNRLQLDASYFGQPAAWTSQPVTLPCAGCSQPETAYERARYRDFTTTAGGPVVRDRLWFFAGYEYLRDFDSQPGTDPLFPRKYEQNKFSWKLTWQISPILRLVHSFSDEYSVAPLRPTSTVPYEATIRITQTAPTATFGNLTYIMAPSTVLDARVGRIAFPQEMEPSTGDRTVANHMDRVTNVQSGGPRTFGDLTRVRTTAKAMVTHVRSGLFRADHELKFGVQIEKGEHDTFSALTTGTRYVDRNGQPFQAISRDPLTAGGQFVTTGLFVTDAISIGKSVTVNAGMRFDRSEASSQDLPARDNDGRELKTTVSGLGHLYTWNVWSPRLGLTMKLTADGRTMLRAGFGRFHQGVLTGEFEDFHPGNTPVTTTEFDPATGRYSKLVSVVDPRVNLVLDREMRSPQTDELSVGVDRELKRNLAMAVAYVHKQGQDFTGYTDIGGQYREETRTLSDGRSIPVFVLTNSTADRRFFLTNPDGYTLTYNGLVMMVEKRRSNGWQTFASYTFSRTEGLQVASGSIVGGNQASSVVSPAATMFGRDPNSLTYARGRLPNDRPHIFRVMGSADVPRTGLVVAANLQYFSGKPWAASTQVALPQGDQRIQLEPRGSQRLPPQTLLDLRMSRPIPCGGLGRIELLLDLLNAFNETAEEDVATDNVFSPTFGQGTVFVDPRRVMLAVRINLGR